MNINYEFEGTTEVVNNLFVLYAYDRVFGNREGLPVFVTEACSDKFFTVESLAEWRSNPWLGLMIFKQLQIAFGWDPFKSVFKKFNEDSLNKNIHDNQGKIITRGMTSIALENHYDRFSGALSFFYNWGRHKIDDGYHPGEKPQTSHFHSKDLMMGVSWHQSAMLFTGNRLTLGFDYQHFGGESWNKVLATGERRPGVNKQMDEFAGYADFRQDIGHWLSLDAGIRIDHHSHVGTEWIPQGGIAVRLPGQSELKAMVSKGFRNPTIREMYMFPPQNPNLKPERVTSCPFHKGCYTMPYRTEQTCFT